MAFDTQAARKAGYSDDEIADYLSSQSGFDAAAARKAGYSSGEIIQAISTRTTQPANDAKPDQGLTPLDTEQVTSARPWQGAGAGRGSPNDPRRVDVERKPEGGLLNEARQLRDETLMGVQQTGAAVSNINAFGQANRLANTEQLIRDLEARGRGDSRAANQLRAEVQSLQERLPATIGAAADANALSQAASQMTTRPAIRKVGEAKTFGEAWEAFKESPYDVIAGVTAQSLPQVLPGLIAAAVTGPAAGAAAMGLNSGAVEFGGSLTEFAQDKGIDTRNAKAVQGFYSDPGNLSEALKYAGTRAGIIGTVDAASGGIAGKTLAPALRSPIKRQAINLPAQMAVQGAAGGGGEAAAQLATKGEIDQPGQVLLEVAGELGGAPAEVAAFTRDSARGATTPSAEAARALSTELDAGQLDPARVETLNPNLAIQRKTQDGLINIGAAQTVDEAIAAATKATSPQDRAVDNIARILGETPNVSQPGDVRPLDSGTPGLGAPEPGIGLEAGMGTDGAAGRPLDAGRVPDQPDRGAAPLADRGPDAQLSPEPASMWFGRRGDGYQTPEDASAALPSRQRIAPDLSWKVEQMPSGRYRLAGYDTQAQQPAPAFQVKLNPTGTATIIGDPAAIKATLAEAGIDKVMSGADRVIVGTSQAQAAVQALEQKQPPALVNTAQPAIESVANDQNNQTREDTQAQAPTAQTTATEGSNAPGAAAKPAADVAAARGQTDIFSAPSEEQVSTKTSEKTGNTTKTYGGYVDGDGVPVELSIVRRADGTLFRVFAKYGDGTRNEFDASYGPGITDEQIVKAVAEPSDWEKVAAKSTADQASEKSKGAGEVTGFLPREGNPETGEREVLDLDAAGSVLLPTPYLDASGNRKLSQPGKVNRAQPATLAEPQTEVPAEGAAAVEGAGVEQSGFDPVAFDKARSETIQKSREAGNIHLDKVPPYVETMRGKKVYYAHDPKVRGTIRTVDNRGTVYVNWDDQYSAEKEMASPTQDGKKTVMQSGIGPRDLKDYVLATNPPKQDQTGGTPDVGAGVSQPMPVAAPQPTAEQKIREAFDSAPRTVGNWHKLTVEHNGKTQEFLANMKRVNTSGKRDSAIHLVNIRPGRMMAGDPVQDLAYYYKLDGKNNLVEEGIPSIATPEQLKAFGRADPRLIPVSQRKQAPYSGPADVSSRAGQIELANRGGRIASLKAMNEQLRKIAPGEAWADSNIESATDLDALQSSISQALVDAGRARANPEQSPLKARLDELSGQELRAVFDVMSLAGSRMTATERVNALLAENPQEVEAALDQVSPRNVPKKQANLNTSAEPVQKPQESEQVEANDQTPKQYHDARLRKMSDDTGTPLAEVREFYDTEGGRAESDRLWSVMVDKRARDGATLARQTLDKFYELNPTARLPETAFPNGYQRPDARKQEAIAKDAIRQDRREAKAARAASEEQVGPYGRDLTPIAQGGKPFKNKAEADKFRTSTSNTLKTVRSPTGKGFAVMEKSAAEILRAERSAKRLRQPNTGTAGEPLHAHGFIAAEGGLSKAAMKDAGFDRNERVGNRWMFSDTGMTIERATEKLIEAGYLRDGASHSDAFTLLNRSANQTPQYTPEGWERMAEAEQEARRLAAQDEANADAQDFAKTAKMLGESELDELDYAVDNMPELSEAGARLTAEEADAIFEEHDANNESAVIEGDQELEQADARAAPPSRGPGDRAPGRTQEGQGSAQEGLTADSAPASLGTVQSGTREQNIPLGKTTRLDGRDVAEEIPVFEDLTAFNKWFAGKAREYGGKTPFTASRLYAAVYPQIKPMADAARAATGEARKAAMTEAGFAVGDRVEMVGIGAFLTMYRYTGTVAMRGSMPIVKLDSEMTVSRNGRVYTVKSVPWDGRWKKTEEAAQPAPTRLAPTNSGARVTPQVASASQLARFIGIAADSIQQLRKMDVDRVISETPAQFKAAVAMHIKDKRPDLASEVDDVLAEQSGGLTAPTEADALRMGLGEFTAANADTLITQPGGTWVLLDGRRASYENPDYSVVFSWGNGRWSSGDMASTPKAAHAVALKRWTDRGNSPESFKQASKDLFLSGVQGPDLLAAPTQADVLAQQDRAAQAEELDQRAQIDREASGFQLQTQTAEQRRENTGDTFGGPSVEDYQSAVERNRKPGTAPEGPDLFAEPEPQQETPQEPAKPAAEMSAAELLRAAADKMEAAEKAKTEPAPTKLQAEEALWDRIKSGTASLDEFKAGFEAWISGKDAIIAELMAKKKDELLSMGGPYFAMRYKSETKPEIADALWREGLGSYALGKSVTYSMGKDSYQNAVRRQVEATDAAELAQHAEDIKARQKEREQRAEQMAKAVEDPQTLADYEALIRAKAKEAGVTTLREARLLLTEEQRATFDRLAAEYTRAQRKDQKEERQAVRVAGQKVDGQIIETKHTQKGHDLFVVQLSERVSTEDYQTLNNNAKRMGGYYSSFRGRGAVAGFQFRDRATAEAFVKLANGDTSEAQQAVDARRDAFADDRSQTAVERLTEMADRLEESADGRLRQDRKVNTERRARMAASAESAANDDKAMAKTMRNIAQAISAGQANMLDRVRTKTQVEMLAGFVNTAKDTELRAKYPSYADQEKRKGQPATGETASYAEFPTFTAYRSDLASLGRQLLEVEGTKKIGTRLMKVADDVSDAYTKFAKENIDKVSQFMRGNDMAVFASKEIAERAIARSGLTGKAIVLPMKRGDNRIILSPSEAINRGVWTGDGDNRITLTNEFGRELVETIGRRANKTNRLTTPWQFETANDRLKALARMGIETAPEFRTALREFIGLQERAQEADRVKMLERAMVGRAKDGLDFFPTPESIADEMVETADIQPGMRVLEPSGGMGHIADRIRKTGAEPDVIELAPARRELLQAKGYELVGSDFMAFTAPLERGFTFGDLMRAPDGTTGILRGKGGMGSDRVQLVADNPEGEFLGYYNFSDLEGVERRGSISGYDRILMNPPFSDRRDAEHVKHAYDLLNPGGRLVAIMGEGVFFGQDKKAQEFRDWLEKVGGTDEKLAEGTFMDPTLPVNTGVNARMVVIDKGEDGNAPAFSRTPAWRSDLRDKVAAIKMESSKEEGWRAYISGLTTKGVKPDEIEWSGVTDWLKLQTGKVTKQQVLDYLDGNGVQVQEVVLQSAPTMDQVRDKYMQAMVRAGEKASVADQLFREMQAFAENGEYDDAMKDRGFDLVMKDGSLTGNEIHDAASNYDGGDSKYSQYTLPGGENYREVLLTLPESKGIQRIKQVQQRLEELRMTEDLGPEFDALRKEEVDLIRGGVDKTTSYRSSHWDTPNVLAHIRLNDRVDADGKRVLFVEEIQSDWGQDGKKKGFKQDAQGLTQREESRFQQLLEDGRRNLQGNALAEFESLLARRDAAANDRQAIPLAPFVTSTDKWLTLALKRVITMAAQEGYDKVAFVNGEQSAERYDLSKQVDTIGYLKHDDGTITIEAEKDGKTLSKDNYPAAKIPDVVGKEIAQKIIDSPDVAGELSGLDLKVGGAGMIQFYDKIIPNTLKDVLKKVGGGGLEAVSIDGATNAYDYFASQQGGFSVINGKDEVIARFQTQEEAAREVDRLQAATRQQQPGFTITDTIREKAAQGLPMFRAGDESNGMALDKAQSIVATQTKKWKNGPDIEVVATPDDLPMEAPADANGMYYKGKVWIVASAHKTPEQISRTLAHEAIAHYGLRNILGADEWRRFMANIQLAIKSGNKPLKDIQARVRRAYVDGQGRFNLTPNQEADEIAAKVVEDAIGPDGEFRPGFGFVKSVYARIVEFLRDLGLDVKLTMAEVQGMLVLAQRNLEAGRRTGGGGEVVVAAARENGQESLMRAYHGTPHKVDKFSTDKIGTGEGAQAFGWGLYFASKKEIAEHYRKGLSYKQIVREFRDQMPDDADFEEALDAADDMAPERARVIRALAADDWLGFDYPSQAITAAFKYLENFDASPELIEAVKAAQGNLYEVEIPEDSEMLLWDKPLSEQPAKVRAIIGDRIVQKTSDGAFASGVMVGDSFVPLTTYSNKKAAEEYNQYADDGRFADAFGEKLYRGLAQTWNGQGVGGLGSSMGKWADMKASEELAAAGIKGIKYLDGSSRADGDGTYNYVVFSGDDVAIQNAMFSRDNPGAPERVAQTDTQAFKSWFGDSVVTDTGKPGGKPLVVYHGTGVNVGNRGEFMSGDFNAFDGDLSGKSSKTGAPESAFFFTDKPDVASSYTVAWRGDFSEKYKDNANVMPVYISMAKPLKVNAKGENWRDILYKGEYRDLNEIVQLAKESGKYDGVIVAKVVDKGVGATTSKTSTTYVAFNPTQIKSATGNNGNFDPSNPDIRFSRGAVEQAPEQPPRPNMLARAVGYQSLDDAGSPEFTPGRMLYNLIGDATGPFLSKWSLKAASPELRKIMRAMKIDVAKAQETAAAVAKESMNLSQDEREMVSDLIEKELRAGVVPPEHAIRLAATINTVMGKQTDELLQLGMLSRESAERWRGEYLPRFYESKLTATATASDLWADAVRKAAGGGKPLKGIRGKHLRGRGMYETIPVTQLADYETMGWEVRDPDYQPGLTDTGMVQVWRDFTRQERDRMGEIRDAGFRFVMGYMQTQKDIALGRMFEALASDPDMSSKYATEDLSVQVPTGNAPGTEVRTYGKLAGRFVSPETLSQLSMIEEAQSEALMMYRKAMGLWKESKTVLNPVAHANNVISNITMAHFAGVSYGRVDKYLSAIKDFATKSDDVLEAKEAGLFLGTMNEAELFQSLPEELKALAQTQESTATKVGRTVFNLMTFYLRKPMGWAYQAEDTFFRYLIYKEGRAKGLEPNDAVDYAQKFIFTYDDLPKRARQIRDYGIPFFAYTYKAIPALLETALTHPERFAAPMAVIMAANAAAYAIAAGDDDDSWELRLKKYLTDKEYREKVREKEKLERELLPEWLRGQTSLRTERTVRLGTDELTKLPMFIDISRMIPGGDMFDMHPNGGGIPWFQPLTPNHPLLSMYGAMHLNKDAFYGKDIINPKTDSDAEAARKRLDWIWKQMTPAIAYGNYHWERWMNALAQATGEEIQWAPEWATDKAIATGIGRDGLPVQPKYAAMQTFGIKVRPYDLDKAEAIAQSVSNKTVREIDAEMSSLRRLNNMGAVSDRTYERAKELADTKKDRLRDGQTVDGEKR